MDKPARTLEQMYIERDRLLKLAKVREDRSAEFMDRATKEMERSLALRERAADTDKDIREKIADMQFAQGATRHG